MVGFCHFFYEYSTTYTRTEILANVVNRDILLDDDQIAVEGSVSDLAYLKQFIQSRLPLFDLISA